MCGGCYWHRCVCAGRGLCQEGHAVFRGTLVVNGVLVSWFSYIKNVCNCLPGPSFLRVGTVKVGRVLVRFFFFSSSIIMSCVLHLVFS